MNHSLFRIFSATLCVVSSLLIAGCNWHTTRPDAPPQTAAPPVKIGLALGGGAARGLAHVGVIKALEAQGIVPDIIVGTSAGAVVGSLYATGMSSFDLQQVALDMNERQVVGLTWPDRGWLDGGVLRDFVNKATNGRRLEAMPRKFAAVATELKTGQPTLFANGDTGIAVQASAAVPGVFRPVNIGGREYVDGGLVSPVPVRYARRMGATFVIAVDISARPVDSATDSSLDVLMQAFNIMGKVIGDYETADADIVIRPATLGLPATDLSGRHRAIMEGEKAVQAILPELKEKLAARRAAALPLAAVSDK